MAAELQLSLWRSMKQGMIFIMKIFQIWIIMEPSHSPGERASGAKVQRRPEKVGSGDCRHTFVL
jgi:hypothetical protein